jgi:hypothetical protein
MERGVGGFALPESAKYVRRTATRCFHFELPGARPNSGTVTSHTPAGAGAHSQFNGS